MPDNIAEAKDQQYYWYEDKFYEEDNYLYGNEFDEKNDYQCNDEFEDKNVCWCESGFLLNFLPSYMPKAKPKTQVKKKKEPIRLMHTKIFCVLSCYQFSHTNSFIYKK